MDERVNHIDGSEPHRLQPGVPPDGGAQQPVAPALEASVATRASRTSKLKIVLLSCIGLVVICALGLGAVLWMLVNHSVSNEQVRAQIESQLNTFLGDNHSAIIGDTKVALGDGGLLSIDARDVKILRGTSTNLGVAREVGVKIKSIPLISGNVVAESSTMRGASVALDAIAPPQADNELRPAWPRTANMSAALEPIGQMFVDISTHVEDAGLESIALEDTNLVGFDQLGLRSRTARLDSLEVRAVEGQNNSTNLDFEALLKTEHSEWALEGT